jgi:hypothetical protein
MAADMKWIQGEVHEDPSRQDADVEKLLRRFVRALIAEQTGSSTPQAKPESAASKND